MQQSPRDRTRGSSNAGISFHLTQFIAIKAPFVAALAGDRDRRLLVYADERAGFHPMIEKLQDSRAVLLGAVAIFAFGLTTSGYALGDGLRRSKMAEHRTVTVRGVSERDVTADLATWTVDFSHQGTDFTSVQQSVDEQARSVRALSQRAGLKRDEIAGGDVWLSGEPLKEQH